MSERERQSIAEGIGPLHLERIINAYYHPFSVIAVEHYLYSPLCSYTLTNRTLTANVLYAIPWPVARAMTTSHLAVNVTTGDEGKVMRMGIYEDNGACYPGDLVVDSGEFSVAEVELSTNAVSQALTKGLYWVAYLTDGTPAIKVPSISLQIRSRDNAPPDGYGAIEKLGSTYGALSGFDPFPSGANISYKGMGPLMRFASLD